MDRLRVAALTDAAGGQLAEVARVFDQYRRHYGEPAAPRQTLAWLTRCTRQGQLTIITAHRGQDLVAWPPRSPGRRPCRWAATGSSGTCT